MSWMFFEAARLLWCPEEGRSNVSLTQMGVSQCWATTNNVLLFGQAAQVLPVSDAVCQMPCSPFPGHTPAASAPLIHMPWGSPPLHPRTSDSSESVHCLRTTSLGPHGLASHTLCMQAGCIASPGSLVGIFPFFANNLP